MQDYSTHIYSFNSEKPPFTNAKIRKAFALAVDRKFIVEKILKNNAKEAYGFVPEGAKQKVVVTSVKRRVIILNMILR